MVISLRSSYVCVCVCETQTQLSLTCRERYDALTIKFESRGFVSQSEMIANLIQL